MRNALLTLVLLFVWASETLAQTDKYWILLKDKGNVHYDPQAWLSERAIARRTRHGVPVTEQDAPISSAYLATLQSMGLQLHHPSRWLNGISATLDPNQAAAVRALPFVKAVKAIPKAYLDMDAPMPMLPVTLAKMGYATGMTAQQLDMVGLDALHQNGLNGRGILIAMMDNGFVGADENPPLKHLFDDNRIAGTWDFVNNEADVFDQGPHGQWCLTIMAGWYEDADTDFNFYGSAHGASFLLLHTEKEGSETTQEEDNWVRAMEYADSAGADVFSTSLGYRDFDGGFDYGYQGMDGNTTTITRAADMAAARGIVVVNSAGNAGQNKITAPADGDSVLAIGAVDSLRMIAGFSSRGPSYDGRIKPDLCAMGVATAYVQPSGVFSRGNGTSFSCPVLSGMAACLLQAKPETKNMDLYAALIQSADRALEPDTVYGYGIPDAEKAYKLLTGKSLLGAPGPAMEGAEGFFIYPNPAQGGFAVALDNETAAYEAAIQWFDAMGRKVLERKVRVNPFYNVFWFERTTDFEGMASGRYVVRLVDGETGLLRHTGSIILTE